MGPKNITAYSIALFAGFVGAFGDALLNDWAKRPSASIATCLAGYAVWNVALLLFTWLLTSNALARAVVLFLVANSVAIACISIFYFREHFTLQQSIGMAIAVIGIVVMETAR